MVKKVWRLVNALMSSLRLAQPAIQEVPDFPSGFHILVNSIVSAPCNPKNKQDRIHPPVGMIYKALHKDKRWLSYL